MSKVTVKPLQWGPNRTTPMFGKYDVYQPRGQSHWRADFQADSQVWTTLCISDTEQEAKDFCQQHHSLYVLSLVEVQP